MAQEAVKDLIKYLEERDRARDEQFAHKERVSSQAIYDLKNTVLSKLAAIEQQVLANGRRHDIANGRTAKLELEVEKLKVQGASETGATHTQHKHIERRIKSLEGDRRWFVVSIVGFVLLEVVSIAI